MVSEKIYLLSFYAFLISIALFRLPYLYLIPGITSAFLTSQALARVLLVASFFTGIFIASKQMKFSSGGRHVNILLLLFFVVSSMSVLSAQNLEAFFTRYKDFFFGILAFYSFYLYRKEEKKIAVALVASIPIMILYQLFLLYGGSFTEVLFPFIYQRHFDILSYNLDRGRIYVDTYDEAFIPLLFTVITLRARTRALLSLTFVSLLSFLAFISNFRTRILMLFISIVGSLAVFEQKTKQASPFLILMLVAVIFVTSVFARGELGGNVFSRLFFESNVEDVATVYTRIDQIRLGLTMGITSPLGVGLGNYYDNLVGNKQTSYIKPLPAEVSAKEYIHNNFATIIAESGYFAFLIFLILLLKFIQNDINVMREKNYFKRSFVVAFWTLFFFGLLNPPIPISYQVLFWGTRGLLFK